jgi:hydrogenase nickel incorporation protein HypA/HybF
MHELYIAECILKAVARSLPDGLSPQRVKTVDVQVGQLDAVVADTLIFMFDAIKGTSGMPNAQLSVKEVEVQCRCLDCSGEFGIELPAFICPRCGSGKVEVLRGRGIALTGITAEDPEGEVHGHPHCS